MGVQKPSCEEFVREGTTVGNNVISCFGESFRRRVTNAVDKRGRRRD